MPRFALYAFSRNSEVTGRSLRVRRRPLAAPILALILGSTHAWAADFYIDPAAGSASGDGSEAKPWQTLEAVVQAGRFGAAIQAGDKVWLRSGYHGAFAPRNGSYATPITVAAAPGQTPEVSRVSFGQTKGWIVSGLSISPAHAPSPQVGTIVQVDKSSADIVVQDCRIFSVADSSSLTASDWTKAVSNGVEASGDRVTLRNNTVKNVRFGISVDGKNALVEYNQVVNFSGDGLRGLGDYGVFQYNVVKNVYVSEDDGDSNHDDGFQSWSVGPGGPGDGVVTGVVLRGNFILNREDPNQKLTNSLQGIGCFDGFFDGWVVENNVVVTDHWHGISFYGMRNSRILNNTVIDVNTVSPGPPWILVTPHKNGTKSENVIIRNNLATDFDLTGNAIVQDHNTTLATADLAKYFVNPGAFDLRLLANAPAVNAGSADQAPALDADRIPRPQGSAVDLGAYEWHEPTVPPVDGGAGAGGGGAGGQGGATDAGRAGSGGAAGRGTGGMDAGRAGGGGAVDAGRAGAGGGGAGGRGGAAGAGGGGSSGDAGRDAGSSGAGGRGGSAGMGGASVVDGGSAGLGGARRDAGAAGRGGASRESGVDAGGGDSDNGAGCSCRAAGARSPGRSAWLLLVALAFARRGRRRLSEEG